MNAVFIHPSRRCDNCAHLVPGLGCLQMVSMADGGERPAGFACDEHQTIGEHALEIHRVGSRVLFMERSWQALGDAA